VIDTHCHIDLYKSPLEVAKACESHKLSTVAVTYLPSHYRMAEQHLKGFRYVRPALGMHPLAAKEHRREMIAFKRLVDRTDLIGEIGLDFSPQGCSTKEVQLETFTSALEVIRARKRFVSLHSRRAEDDVLQRLKAAGIERAVFHWFSGSHAQLIRIIDGGHYLSINAEMIRGPKWSKYIRLVPKDRILTESDGPFAKTGGKPVTPTSVSAVVSWLANNWSDSPAEVEERIRNTFEGLVEGIFPEGGG